VCRRRPGDGDGRGTPQLSDQPDLAPLERIAREIAAEWGVEFGPRFALARYSFVAAAGDGAVLKVTPPEDDESDEEADALALWDGDGAVRLLRRDRARRALLVERAWPGDDVAALPDDEPTRIAVEVGLRLWRPAAEPFRWIGDWVPRWLDNAGGHPLIPLARELYDSLDVGRDVLVHGDFHHHDILLSERGPLAIDAKAMLGEPEYDIPSFLWNPIPYRMELGLTERRLAVFADAGLDEERMRKWTVIRGAYLGADMNEIEVLRALL
jgi:streptomycin 6-kinase